MIDITQTIDVMQTALLRDMGEDVDLIFRFGSMLRGNTHTYSDLDIAYTPREGTPYHGITVMVADVLVDLFPIGWGWLERMSTFDNINTTLLESSQIIYQRDEAAAARFAALRDDLRARLRPEARPEMVGKALEIFQRTGYPYYLLREAAQDGRLLACFYHTRNILQTVLHSLGALNQVCLDTRKRDEVLALPRLPADFAATLDRVTSATDPAAMVAATDALLRATRALLVAEQAQAQRVEGGYPVAMDSAYPELKNDLQHVMLAAEREDWFDLKLFSFYHELMIHMAQAETGIAYSGFNGLTDYEQDLAARGFPDLTAAVVAGDFGELRRRCVAFDDRLRAYLTEKDVALNSFGTLDELRAYLGL